MSDESQGTGWWTASDGKWYPPQEHPNYLSSPLEAAAITSAAAALPPPLRDTAPRRPSIGFGTVRPTAGLSRKSPVYKQWWLWTGIGVLVALGISVAVISLDSKTRLHASASKPEAPSPTGTTSSAPISSPASASSPPTTSTTSPVTALTTAPSLSPPPTTSSKTTRGIAGAYNTFFNLSNGSIFDKMEVLEDGPSFQAALTSAFISSIGASATGASVQSVTVWPDSECQTAHVSTPCAKVIYAVLGPGGQGLLTKSAGYAVEVNGQWLVSKATACGFFQLLHQTMGDTSPVPGCY